MEHEIASRALAIQSFIDQSSRSEIGEHIQSYLFRFGSVLICGYIERSVEIIVLHRLSRRAHPRVLSFVKSHFARGRNFDCGAVTVAL